MLRAQLNVTSKCSDKQSNMYIHDSDNTAAEARQHTG